MEKLFSGKEKESSSNKAFDFSDIDFEFLLGKHGPDGLYELADRLKDIADKDVSAALNEN